MIIRELNKDSDYLSIKEISAQAWKPIYLHRKNNGIKQHQYMLPI